MSDKTDIRIEEPSPDQRDGDIGNKPRQEQERADPGCASKSLHERRKKQSEESLSHDVVQRVSNGDFEGVPDFLIGNCLAVVVQAHPVGLTDQIEVCE